MTVSVLIVNYLTGDLAWETAEGVLGPGVSVDIFDNSGECLEWASPPPNVQVHGTGANINYTAANNALVAATRSKYICLLNPDAALSYDQLRILVERLEANPTAWGVAPQLVNTDGTDQAYVRRPHTLVSLLADRMPPLRLVARAAWARYLYADRSYVATGVVANPPGACILLRRGLNPLLDERFPLFFSDTVLAEKLNEHGKCLYAHDVRVPHLRGASLKRARTASTGGAFGAALSYDKSALLYARHRKMRGIILLRAVLLIRRLGYRLAGCRLAFTGRSV